MQLTLKCLLHTVSCAGLHGQIKALLVPQTAHINVFWLQCYCWVLQLFNSVNVCIILDRWMNQYLNLTSCCVFGVINVKEKQTQSCLRWHLMPTSSKWLQLWTPIPVFWQSYSLASLPVHTTLSNQIAPVPWPIKKTVVPACGKLTNIANTGYELLINF